MKPTKTMIMAGIGLVMTAAAVMVVKGQFFPAVKDSYFTPDSDKLRQVPAGIVVVRPTHFSSSAHDGIRHVHDGDSLARTVGHDVLLRDVMAEAYDCSPARVVLPPDAPKDGFDFLVTVGKTREHLRTAIQKQLGFTAHRETRETDVLMLTVANPGLPGLTISAADEESDTDFKDGKLYFKHQPLSVMFKGLEAGLTLPVQDQTGLTNYYDFSVVWNPDIQKRMQAGAFNLDGVKRVLAGWGLRLEPDTASLDMFIVEKSR
jgi:uncharacterized protein (TIGR03435 family)